MRRRFFVMNESILTYTSTTKSKLAINTKELNTSIKSHTYNEVGLIKFNGVISEIGSIFNSASLLLTCVLPDSVTTIEFEAFAGCTSLTSVTIGNSVTTIGNCAFYSCDSLTSVNIPESVTTIGERAFYGCSSLTDITIPDRITQIGYMAFSSCISLKSVYCKAITPPIVDGYGFSNNSSNCKIYVPYQSLDAYKTATYWSDYADDIVGYDFENDAVVGGKQVINIKWITSVKISNSPLTYAVEFEIETNPSTSTTITLLGKGQEIGVFEEMFGLGNYSSVNTTVNFEPTIDDFSLMPSEDDKYIYKIIEDL